MFKCKLSIGWIKEVLTKTNGKYMEDYCDKCAANFPYLENTQ